MPTIKWVDPTVAGPGSGTYADPYNAFSSVTGVAGGDEIRLKSTATLVNEGAGTWTFKGTSVALTPGHGVVTGDIISPGDNVWYYCTVSGNTATIAPGCHKQSGSYTVLRLRPVAISAWSNIKARLAVSGTNHTSRLSISGNWDSATTQNGYTVLNVGGGAYYFLDGYYSGAWTDISNLYLHNMQYGIRLYSGYDSTISKVYCAYFVTGGGSALLIYNNEGSGNWDCEIFDCTVTCNSVTGYAAINVQAYIPIRGAQLARVKLYRNIIVSGYMNVVNCQNAQVSFNTFYGNNIGQCLLAIGSNIDCLVDSNTFDSPSSLATRACIQTSGETVFRRNTFTNMSTYNIFDCAGYWARIISVDDSAADWTHFVDYSYSQYVIKIHNSSVKKIRIGYIGVITQNTGDASIGLPAGLTWVTDLLMNGSSQQVGPKRPALDTYSSMGFAQFLCERPNAIWLPAGTYTVRRYVNTQIASLTNAQLWMEILNGTTLVKSNNAALAVAANKDDWSQYIQSDSFTLASAGLILINEFMTFYHASSKVFLGHIAISKDGGAYVNLTQNWVDGEPTYSLPPGNPAAADVRNGTHYDPFAATVGTLSFPAIYVSDITESTTDIAGHGGGFLVGGAGSLVVDGTTLTPDSLTDTYFHAPLP
jgi:hypothetical protein